MIETWRTIVWEQFGAAIDMLNYAVQACPDPHWRDSVWDDPSDDPGYTQFWFIAYHTVAWLDRYLSSPSEDFTLPPPFIRGALPKEPYSKEDVLAYLKQCRQKCQDIFATLTDEKANQGCEFPWGEQVSYAELQLYNMRHVQEHASQLSLHLGHRANPALDWVARASHKAA